MKNISNNQTGDRSSYAKSIAARLSAPIAEELKGLRYPRPGDVESAVRRQLQIYGSVFDLRHRAPTRRVNTDPVDPEFFVGTDFVKGLFDWFEPLRNNELLVTDPVNFVSSYKAKPTEIDENDYRDHFTGCAVDFDIRLLPALTSDYPGAIAAHVWVGKMEMIIELDLWDHETDFNKIAINTRSGVPSLEFAEHSLYNFFEEQHVDPIAQALLAHVRYCASVWGSVENLIAGVKDLAPYYRDDEIAEV